MKKKLNKGFEVLYIINCIVFAIVLFWLINTFTYDSGSLMGNLVVGFYLICLYLINYVISLIIFIITTILGINNYKKSLENTIKKKITIMLSILGMLHIILLLGTVISILSA